MFALFEREHMLSTQHTWYRTGCVIALFGSKSEATRAKSACFQFQAPNEERERTCNVVTSSRDHVMVRRLRLATSEEMAHMASSEKRVCHMWVGRTNDTRGALVKPKSIVLSTKWRGWYICPLPANYIWPWAFWLIFSKLLEIRSHH